MSPERPLTPMEPAAAGAWPLPPPQGPLLLEQPAVLLRLDGPDSLRFLHGQSSQDLQLARPGQWRRSCGLTPTARVTALVEVLADADGAWLVITAGDGASVRQQLDRVLFPADQVTLGTLEPVRLIERLPAQADGEGSPIAPDPDQWTPLAGAAEAGFQLGADLLVLRGSTPLPAELAAWPRLDAAAAEPWRIRRGRAAAPGELNGDTNPFELGLAARVSLTKGCYAGQETLARLVTYDGIKQQLRRWHWLAPAALADRWLERLQPGQALCTAGGERAGRITSLTRLEAGSDRPGGSQPAEASVLLIGLALVRRTALVEPWLTVGDGDATAAPEAGEAPQLQLTIPEEFSLPGA